jgi:hypothetical protein
MLKSLRSLLTAGHKRPRQASHMDYILDPMGTGAILVTPIGNGYLVSTPTHSTGDTFVRAAFARDLDEVRGMIAREIAQMRLDF